MCWYAVDAADEYPVPVLQSWFVLFLEASDSERWKIIGRHFSQAELTQELANNWSKLEAVTWRREVITVSTVYVDHQTMSDESTS